VQQTQTETLNVSGQVFYKTSSNTVTYTGANAKRGWYLDWPTVGERTVSNGGIVSKRLMYIRSRVPAIGSQTLNTEETCEPTATPPDEYLTLVDILSGKPATEPVFDDNGGGFTGTETTGLTRWKTGKDPILAQKTGLQNSVFVRPRQGAMSINAGAITLPRVGWRQLQ
jgi:type IV pilus assembly protein PilY1